MLRVDYSTPVKEAPVTHTQVGVVYPGKNQDDTYSLISSDSDSIQSSPGSESKSVLLDKIQALEQGQPASLAVTSVTVDPEEVDIKAEQKALEGHIKEIRDKLKELNDNLKTGLLKPFLLSKKEINDLKTQIERVGKLVNRAEAAAKAVILERRKSDLVQLENIIEEVIDQQSALHLSSDSPKFRLLRELALLLGALTSALWPLAIKMGFLAATSPLVIWSPFAVGIAAIFIRAGQLVKIYIIDEKRVEDRRSLVNIYSSLFSTLRGVKKKMKVSTLVGIASQLEEVNQILRRMSTQESAVNGQGHASRSGDATEVKTAEQALEIITTSSGQKTPSPTSIDSFLEDVAKQLVENGVDEKEAWMVTGQFNQKLQEALARKKQAQEEIEAAELKTGASKPEGTAVIEDGVKPQELV